MPFPALFAGNFGQINRTGNALVDGLVSPPRKINETGNF